MSEVEQSKPEVTQEVSGAASKAEEQPKQEPNDAFAKLLKEKKNAMTRIRELEDSLKEKERNELIQKEEWKTLAEQREAEIKEIQDRLNSREKEIEQSIKMSQVRKELLRLGASDKYLDHAMKLVDLNSISYDGETGVVSGADSAALVIKETLPPLFGSAGVGVDNSAPVGTGKPLTMEEWKNLPYDEQMKRKKELLEGMGIKTRR